MRNNQHIEKIFDYSNSLDVFQNVDIGGGVCYFLWNKEYNGDCTIVNASSSDNRVMKRPLNEYEIIVRSNSAISIIDKVKSFHEDTLSSIVSTQRPFGLRTYIKPEEYGDYKLRWSGGVGNIGKDKVTTGLDMIDKWKVMISYLTAEHAGQPDKNGMYRVLSTNELLPPNYVCTEAYLIAGCFDSKCKAENYLSYLRTKFVRYLLLQYAVSQHLSQISFSFIPVQNFDEKWTDERLYDKYGLSKNEINKIESLIKPMK